MAPATWLPGPPTRMAGALNVVPVNQDVVYARLGPPSDPKIGECAGVSNATKMIGNKVSEIAATELSVQGESVQRLYSQYTQGRYLVNRRYQRKLVWAVDEKAKLIDSMIKRLPIPLILLAETADDGLARFEVIDGLQRLNALFSFIQNDFPVDQKFFDLETLADTKFLKDRAALTQKTPVLERTVCLDIANYLLPVSVYKSASESSVDEVFRRINSSGRYLSLQEIRQAGATVEIAQLVRRISAAIRGDASLTDYVKLEDMARISITSQKDLTGIYDAEIFWVKEGILSREAVRESRDEELVLDILLDIILRPMASSGTEYRNAAYGNQRRRASTAEAAVSARLATIGTAEVERRFMTTLDLLAKTLQVADVPYDRWSVTQERRRGVPRQFHAIFVAVEQLIDEENLEPVSFDILSKALKGFWDKDLTTPGGGGNWGGERKIMLFDAVKGRLRSSFKPTSDKHSQEVQEHALRFESTLRMALTEEALFELKQGFCRLEPDQTFDDASFDKILRTASAMANTRPGAKGYIFIGVADKEADAAAVQRVAGVMPHRLDHFYITGTQHELDVMRRSIDEHFRWLIERIKNSKLENQFAQRLATSLAMFRYNNYLIWKLEPEAQSKPVAFDDRFYTRHGPETVEVTGTQNIIELVRRFPE